MEREKARENKLGTINNLEPLKSPNPKELRFN